MHSMIWTRRDTTIMRKNNKLTRFLLEGKRELNSFAIDLRLHATTGLHEARNLTMYNAVYTLLCTDYITRFPRSNSILKLRAALTSANKL